MDKDRLNLLLNNIQELTADDLHLLKALKKEHPYMQGIYPLIAYGYKKYNSPEYKKSLQTAAIYSIDRLHLKVLLQSSINRGDKEASTDSSGSAKQIVSKTKTEHKIAPLGIQDEHLTDSFFKELYDEMDQLKKSKEAYNNILSKIETASTQRKKSKASSSTKEKKTNSAAKETSKKSTPLKKKTTSPKKSAKPKKEGKLAKAKPNKVIEVEQHSIIEEIKLKEIKAISDEHLMEQINMITSFIEKEPSINKKMINHNVDAKRIIEDLSESSTHLADDVISETLAKLMVKQGRKEKAIDIYKKLIWKFPQKKSYFADQIKKLKIEE